MSGTHLSKSFFELIKAIGEARTKMDEDRIITEEVTRLKQKLSKRRSGSKSEVKEMRELVIRMIYCEMLGHDASFGHIHAVNLASQDPQSMRIGFLACSLCLSKTSELLLLSVNSLVAGLKSQNFVVLANTLTAICQLGYQDALPVLKTHIERLCGAKEAIVRKKTAMVMRYFWTLDPSTLQMEKVKKLLCDRDPSVMGASLHILYEVICSDPQNYKDLISSFVSILKQIVDHQLPRDYDYHRIPAPWIQLKLLQILARLGEGDQRASEDMYTILDHVMKRADVGINVGYAIIYQCVLTIVTIYPKNDLLAKAAESTKRFFTSENPNLKYLGVKALGRIVRINPAYGADHQDVILECLDHSDETLKRRALDLLYAMTNEDNMAVIVEKLIVSLQETRDRFARKDLIIKITKLLEKYCSQPDFYVDMMHVVLKEGAGLVPEITVNTVMSTIATLIEESGDEPVVDDETITEYIMKAYWDMLQAPLIEPKQLRIFAWVIGEYGHLSKEILPDDLLSALWDSEAIPSDSLEATEDFRPSLVFATSKLCSRLNLTPNVEIMTKLKQYQQSTSTTLSQMAWECSFFMGLGNASKAVFPELMWTEEVEVDDSLPFVDDMVAQQLANGAKEYSSPDDLGLDVDAALKLNHREDHAQSLLDQGPVDPAAYSPQMGVSDALRMPAASALAPTVAVTTSPGLSSAPAPRKWGAAGYSGPLASKQATKPSPAIAPQVPSQPAPPATMAPAAPEAPAPTQPPPAEPAPEAPLTQQQLFAKALFGGGSKPGSSLRRKGRSNRRTYRRGAGAKSKSPPTTAQKPAPQQPPVDDLLDLSALGPAQPAEQKEASKPAPSSDPMLDLFGSVTAPAAAAEPAPAAAKPTEPEDFLGGILGPAAPAAPAAKPKSDGVFDLLMGGPTTTATSASSGNNFLGSLGSPSGAAAGGQQSYAKGSAAVSGKMALRLSQLKKSKENDDVIANDLILRVGSYKAFAPYKGMHCLFFTNLSNVTMHIQFSVVCQAKNLKIGIDTDGEPAPKLVNAYTATVSVEPTKTSAQFVSFGPENPMNIPVPAVLQGNIDYTLGTEPKKTNLRFRLQMGVEDIIRPASITTPQFGVNWQKLPGQQRIQINCSYRDIQSFTQRLQRSQFQVVQVIKHEVIAAGMVRSVIKPEHVIPVLVHSQFNNGVATCVVKSAAAGVTSGVAKHLQGALQ